jgi:hypothetical protein
MTQLISKAPAYIAARNVLGDVRKVFDGVEEALTALRSIYATEGFPADFPTVAARVGAVDVSNADSIPPVSDWPAEYATSLVAVSFIGVRGLKADPNDPKSKDVNGARGFSIYPLYSIDSIRADESGEKWLWKVTEKEASHVAMRGLRNVAPALGTDALAQAAMAMPLTVSDYVEESESEAMDTTAFDSTWKDFRVMLAQDPATAALVPSLPSKSEVLKCIRSKPYAVEQYDAMESIGTFEFIGNTMAAIIDHMRERAIASGEEYALESTEIRDWLANRATKTFAGPRKPELDVKSVDFASFMKAAAPATPAA